MIEALRAQVSNLSSRQPYHNRTRDLRIDIQQEKNIDYLTAISEFVGSFDAEDAIRAGDTGHEQILELQDKFSPEEIKAMTKTATLMFNTGFDALCRKSKIDQFIFKFSGDRFSSQESLLDFGIRLFNLQRGLGESYLAKGQTNAQEMHHLSHASAIAAKCATMCIPDPEDRKDFQDFDRALDLIETSHKIGMTYIEGRSSRGSKSDYFYGLMDQVRDWSLFSEIFLDRQVAETIEQSEEDTSQQKVVLTTVEPLSLAQTMRMVALNHQVGNINSELDQLSQNGEDGVYQSQRDQEGSIRDSFTKYAEFWGANITTTLQMSRYLFFCYMENLNFRNNPPSRAEIPSVYSALETKIKQTRVLDRNLSGFVAVTRPILTYGQMVVSTAPDNLSLYIERELERQDYSYVEDLMLTLDFALSELLTTAELTKLLSETNYKKIFHTLNKLSTGKKKNNLGTSRPPQSLIEAIQNTSKVLEDASVRLEGRYSPAAIEMWKKGLSKYKQILSGNGLRTIQQAWNLLFPNQNR